MIALGCIALALSALSVFAMVLAAIVGNTESSRHQEYQAIGWAAVAALFFITGRA